VIYNVEKMTRMTVGSVQIHVQGVKRTS
jgi:uncharacterized alkaline shock family protein YloU